MMAKAKDTAVRSTVSDDDKPAVTSGLHLLKLLKESGTGQDKLNMGLAVFPRHKKTGQLERDVDASEVLEALEDAQAEDDGSVPPSMVVPEATKEKARQFYRTGRYEPIPEIDPAGIDALLEKFQPIVAQKLKKTPVEKAVAAPVVPPTIPIV